MKIKMTGRTTQRNCSVATGVKLNSATLQRNIVCLMSSQHLLLPWRTIAAHQAVSVGFSRNLTATAPPMYNPISGTCTNMTRMSI